MRIIETPKEFYTAFSTLIRNIDSILIMSHTSPDDDSISSVLTLYSYITCTYPDKKVSIIYSGEQEKRWAYFEHFDKIIFTKELTSEMLNYEILVGVDACQLSRFSDNVELLNTFSGKKVFIDHHPNTPDEHDLALIRPDYPACSHLLYDIFYLDREFHSARLPETIILGILGDTGSFKFIKPEQSSIFLVAERLIREGKFDIQNLMAQYSTYSENILFVLQELVANISYKEIGLWPRFMYSYLSREFIIRNQISDSIISSASGIFVGTYGTSLTECTWSITFTSRQDGKVSASMRSRPGSVNVRLIGQKMGNGGGHDRAGGAKFSTTTGEPLSTEAAINELFRWLESHTPDFSCLFLIT